MSGLLGSRLIFTTCWVACNALVKVLAAFYCVHLLHKIELKDRGGIRKCLYSSIIVSVLNSQP